MKRYTTSSGVGLPNPYIPRFMETSVLSNGLLNLNAQGDEAYLQDYRNELLESFMVPRYLGGLADTPFTPRADLVFNHKRKMLKKQLEIPKVYLRCINLGRSMEVDNFYDVCQMQRERYSDRMGKTLPLEFFTSSMLLYQNAPSANLLSRNSPTTHAKHKHPLVVPLDCPMSKPPKPKFFGNPREPNK